MSRMYGSPLPSPPRRATTPRPSDLPISPPLQTLPDSRDECLNVFKSQLGLLQLAFEDIPPQFSERFVECRDALSECREAINNSKHDTQIPINHIPLLIENIITLIRPLQWAQASEERAKAEEMRKQRQQARAAELIERENYKILWSQYQNLRGLVHHAPSGELIYVDEKTFDWFDGKISEYERLMEHHAHTETGKLYQEIMNAFGKERATLLRRFEIASQPNTDMEITQAMQSSGPAFFGTLRLMPTSAKPSSDFSPEYI